MMRRLVRAAISNATVTCAEGTTVKLDPVILRAANILPLEEVEVINVATRARYSTFAEAGAPGEVNVPGVRTGDVVSIVAWGVMHDGQTLNHTATIVTLDGANAVVAVEETAVRATQ